MDGQMAEGVSGATSRFASRESLVETNRLV